MEIASLVASGVSVILGFVAIWLSFQFYKLSSQNSNDIKDAAKNIGSSVERLEMIFEKLYNDTFTMMRDTYSDMRKQLWPDEETDYINEVQETKQRKMLEEVKEDISKKLSEILQEEGNNEDDIEKLIEKAINKTREVENEIKEEKLRNTIYLKLKEINKDKLKAKEIVKNLPSDIDLSIILKELVKLKENGKIDYNPVKESGKHEIQPNTIININ